MTKRMTKEDKMRVFYETLGSINYHLRVAEKLLIHAYRRREEVPEEYRYAFCQMVKQHEKTQAYEVAIRNSVAEWLREQGKKYIRKEEDAQ